METKEKINTKERITLLSPYSDMSCSLKDLSKVIEFSNFIERYFPDFAEMAHQYVDNLNNEEEKDDNLTRKIDVIGFKES